MDEDLLNIEMRKFLKEVGVTSQRRIEQAIQAAVKDGKLKGNESLNARMTLVIDAIGFRHEVAGDIRIGS